MNKRWRHTNLITSLMVVSKAQPPKSVAVFCSPLRRAVGTALMISPAATDVQSRNTSENYDPIEWGLPECRTGDVTAKLVKRNSTIPIVILNGLCDCAAQIDHIGGHQNAIRAGFMSCAADSTNDCQPGSPIMVEMDRMAPLVQNVVTRYRGDDVSSSQPNPIPLQFMKLRVGQKKNENQFVPMIPPLSYQVGLNPSFVHRSFGTNETAITSRRENGKVSAVEEAVLLSIEGGCDTCIIVSHREEIRDLYKRKCKYDYHGLGIPYCCIGRFVVSFAKDAHSPINATTVLNWSFHGLTAPNEMVPALIPSIQSNLAMSNPLSFGIYVSLEGRPTMPICDVTCDATSLLLGVQPTLAQVVSVETCKLTGFWSNDACSNSNATSFHLVELAIVKGQLEWLGFLRTVRMSRQLRYTEAWNSSFQMDRMFNNPFGFQLCSNPLSPVRQIRLGWSSQCDLGIE